MSPRHRARDAETIVQDADRQVVLQYDHRPQRYELVHYDHGGLEASIPFVAVDVGEYDFRLLRRRELGSHAKGVEIEGAPVEAFGEAIGDVLEEIDAGEHPEACDHA